MFNLLSAVVSGRYSIALYTKHFNAHSPTVRLRFNPAKVHFFSGNGGDGCNFLPHFSNIFFALSDLFRIFARSSQRQKPLQRFI